MNVDEILRALNEERVDYLLIGGMNFLLRHLPELTFDVDIWVRDERENLNRLSRALRRLGAQWGRTEAAWAPVPEDWQWLATQAVFCLTTQHGALDVFREVLGLEGRYAECKTRAVPAQTANAIPFQGLCDQDMLAMNRDALKREEERKRDAAYDPVARWRHIQQTITWAEANLPPHLRRNRPRQPKLQREHGIKAGSDALATRSRTAACSL